MAPFSPLNTTVLGPPPPQTPGSASQSSGHLLLMRDGPRGIEDTERGLILAVGGDTLSGIALLMQGRDGERPLCLDLLWTVLQRGKELSKRDWRLERVAIVELRGMAYIGRLFFGDGAGGAAWDCDCRPSDGCWLSLKEKCPIYIHRRVWEDNSTPLRDLARKDDAPSPLTQRRGKGGATLGMDGVVLGSDNSLPSQVTSIRDSDPELLKRLKMEMRVALKDEDYATATRLRDHPFMRLHARILTAEKEGAADEVQRLRDELDFTVATYEQTGVLPEVHPSEQREKRRSTDAEQ
ncbi:hypothetical protein F751_0667 [Auxenochlorella protothecoides]|uniref:BFN domain-containing protein n=1 Tax=Auxenochlorella protothecoides TaxID=3075 RepID=A0A087SQH7_AUXPR|nr:hypothetical protein F751_0667 [Auxenochlorella protothecoides]KFM27981.1 hypothetical protein F751_0667 [Auxenochlorella protothecoides]